jgi:DNA-binding GntR family transcriptional regulator
VRADVVIECTHATHAISEHLAIPMGAPILVHHYTAYISSGQPVVCGETFSRTDRSCYSVVLSKEALASSTPTENESS